MSWPPPGPPPTDPQYYTTAASELERSVRADFARAYQLVLIAPAAESPEQTADLGRQAAVVADRWTGRDAPDEARQLWQQLASAVAVWGSRPETARRMVARVSAARADGDLDIDQTAWRTVEQAMLLTGHAEPRNTGPADAARTPARAADAALAEQLPERARRLTRFLGPPRPELSLDEVDRIITGTEHQLLAEAHAADADTGDDADAVLPAHVRTAPISTDYTAREATEQRQIAALRRVQDLSAEHTRRADAAPYQGLDQTVEQRDDALVAWADGLDAVLEALRAARREALDAGLDDHVVRTAYDAGLDGTYWHQHPCDPHLGRIAALTEQRDHALAEAARLRDTVAELTARLDTPSAAPHSVEHEHLRAADDVIAAIDAVLPDQRSGPAAYVWDHPGADTVPDHSAAVTDHGAGL
ncbi:hypothetical protein [Nocardia puris]|uniref:hypothetical protein n=1 Tax=Nocardia puris TaxID=208602 RepID=UPI002E2501A4